MKTMSMKRQYLYHLLILFCLSASVQAYGQRIPSSNLGLNKKFIEKQLNNAIAQYQTLMKRLPEGVLPRTYLKENDSLVVSKSKAWISGFYPGTLWYLYEYSQESPLRQEAEARTQLLEKEKNNRGTHDLGFMLYCSFGNGLRLTGNSSYKDILLTAANSLSSRFNPTVGCIRSWDHNGDKWKFPVIIDNMMNLELLNWASKVSGEEKYKDIALSHANTTLKNHFRPDYSSYHVVDYDPETGKVLHKQTHQGAFDESAWARGQAWGLYGYTMMYRFTKQQKYLNQAKHIAHFILRHPNLPADKIPYWDYNAKDTPNAPRDASAAAITASALLELCTYTTGKDAEHYLRNAEQILQSLSSSHYSAEPGTNGGFILKHSTGHFPGNSEIDVPLSYADYYYVESLMRYRTFLIE